MSSKRPEVVLPDEIIFEILSWLPVYSLLRMKCVSKLWNSITKESKFIKEHMNRGATSDWGHSTTSTGTRCVGCCRGLALERTYLTNKYRLRNPWTRKVLQLPEPHHKSILGITMCYIPSTNELKLVYTYLDEKNPSGGGCKILTVGTDPTWRTLDFPLSYKPIWELRFVCLEEVCYIISLPSGKQCHAEVGCLELKNERFSSVIKTPPTFFSDWTGVTHLDWEGKLSIGNLEKEEPHFWILENHREQKWAEKKIAISVTCLKEADINENRQPIVRCSSGDDVLLLSCVHSYKDLFFIDVASRKDVERAVAPVGQRYLYYYGPSLLDLKGMQPEE